MTEQEIIKYLKENKTKGVAFGFMPQQVREWADIHPSDIFMFFSNYDGKENINVSWRFISNSNYVLCATDIICLPQDYVLPSKAVAFTEKLVDKLDQAETIANHYGKLRQLTKTTEELGELIQAVAKYRLSPSEDNKKHIVEEIADVVIMLMQLDFLLDFDPDELSDMVDQKLNRQLERIEGKND